MRGNVAVRCLAGGLSLGLACGAGAAQARDGDLPQGSVATLAAPANPQAFALPEMSMARAARNWDMRLKLSGKITLNAGSADLPAYRSAHCALPVLASLPDGSCVGPASQRLGLRADAVALELRLDDELTIYAKTGRSYRTGARQLRSIGMIGSVDTSISDRPQVRFEHRVGIRDQFFDRAVSVNVAGYYNRVKTALWAPTMTTPTGARFSSFINPTTLRNMGLEADLTVRPSQGLALYGSVAANREKFKLCAGGFCPGHARDILQTQVNLGFNYQRPLAIGTVGLNVNYNWTGRGRLVSPVNSISSTVSPERFRRAFVRRAASTIDASVALGLADSPIELYAFGRNLTNRQFMQHRRVVYDVSAISLLNPPRSYGAGLSMAF